MCRSKGSRVCGKELGAARELRNLIVVALAGSSAGRSPSVFTVQRSTPHATFPVAADVGAGLDAQAASSVATAAITAAKSQEPAATVRGARVANALRGPIGVSSATELACPTRGAEDHDLRFFLIVGEIDEECEPAASALVRLAFTLRTDECVGHQPTFAAASSVAKMSRTDATTRTTRLLVAAACYTRAASTPSRHAS